MSQRGRAEFARGGPGRQGRGDRGGRGGSGEGRGGRGSYEQGRGRGGYVDRGRGPGRQADRGGRAGQFQGGRGRADAGPSLGGQAQPGTAANPARSEAVHPPKYYADQLEAVLKTLPPDLLALSDRPRPTRQGFGRAGRAITVKANHFPVACALLKAAHYDVTVTGARGARGGAEGGAGDPSSAPTRPLPPRVCRAALQQLAEDESWPPGWVFDGVKNIYAPLEIRGKGRQSFIDQAETAHNVEVHMEDSPKPRKFIVTIKWANDVDISALADLIEGRYAGSEFPQDAVQALDVAFKHGVSLNPECEPIARAFFVRSNRAMDIGNGAEVWLGFQQSLRPTQGGLKLNIDTAATAFLAEQPVAAYLMHAVGARNEQGLSNMTQDSYRRANAAIRGIRVEVRHGAAVKRRYLCSGLTQQAADEARFENEKEGTSMTVAEYFRQAYGIALRLARLPCLNMGKGNKPNWQPIELCWIAKGQRRMKLDERQQANMVRVAAQDPKDRQRWIEHCANDVAKLHLDPSIAAFGLSVSMKMSSVSARQLPPPALTYRDQRGQPTNKQVTTGAWDLRNLKFNTSAALGPFAVASFDRPDGVAGAGSDSEISVEGFMHSLLDMLEKLGLSVARQGQYFKMPDIAWGNARRTAAGDTIAEAVRNCQEAFGAAPNIIFVNLPTNAVALYQEVKRATDSFIGIPSQCFVSNNASIGNPGKLRGRLQYTANLGMKINAKLGGTNVAMAPNCMPAWAKQADYMIFGADVTHPMGFRPKGEAGAPSVAALVGSLDRQCSKFASRVWLQGHRVEMMHNLRENIRSLLMDHYRASGKSKPARLIFYRDGISEGQFAECQRTEIPQILAACRALDEAYNPLLTFIVVQKRHHTRIFPDSAQEADRTGNCLAGTVVDRDITHPTENAFFLMSHAGLKGTSRPTHYHVLYDANNFGPDTLQGFSYNLCYLFCRCTRSVSVCPPAYYAHLAAFRGRAMLADAPDSASESSGTAGTIDVRIANINEKLKATMFYV